MTAFLGILSALTINGNVTLMENGKYSPISYYVGYSKYWELTASWSGTVSYSDYDSSYLVLDYFKYAQTFVEFADKYPSFTIVTAGKAISESTFGDVGKDKFGTFNLDTITFYNTDRYKYIYFVEKSDKKALTYSINIKIGLRFNRTASKLYLTPFLDASLYSAGAYSRKLEFGLNVYSVTFNPKKN